MPLIWSGVSAGQPILWGSRWGATLAAWVALDHPERVASLVLSGGQAHPGFAERLEWSVARIMPERLVVGGVPGELKKSFPALPGTRVGHPAFRMNVIANVGHVWNLQEPELFARTVDDFIRTISP